MEVMFTKLRKSAVVPAKRPADAGLDLYCCSDQDLLIEPLATVKVPTGIAAVLPSHSYMQICERSRTGSIGLKVSGGIVDANFRGEICVFLTNVSNKAIRLVLEEASAGTDYGDETVWPMRRAIAQGIVHRIPRIYVREISSDHFRKYKNTERGTGMQGSSGK